MSFQGGKESMSSSYQFTVDIEVYNTKIDDGFCQAKYLVHGYNDLCWTDNLDNALLSLKESIIKENNKNK